MKGIITLLLALIGGAFLPAAHGSELGDVRCYRCHKELPARFSRGTPHEPVLDGDCYACHDAHGAARELRLLAQVPELCFECHDGPEGIHLHDPVAEGDCLACHDPHNSEHSPLLVEAAPALCAACHDEKGNERFAHNRDCFECHHAHGAKHPNLLAAAYPEQRRVDFTPDAYELCFRCHSIEAISDPFGSAPTAFRTGKRNLHFVHTVGSKPHNPYSMKELKPQKPGLACSGCHQVHGSEQPKAVRTSFEQNGFTVYNMRFTRTERSGGCVVGCHKPASYERTVNENLSAGGNEPDGKGVN